MVRAAQFNRIGLFATLATIVFLSSACSSRAVFLPTITRVSIAPATQPVPVTGSTQTPTGTPVPAGTSVPTGTSIPTGTPALAVTENGLSAWCMPDNILYTARSLDSLDIPAKARLAQQVNGVLDLPGLPASACVFVYTFNQPAPAGLRLQLFERNAATPWLTADLLPVPGSPNSAATVLRHTYIIEPPFWSVTYEFTVVDSSGALLRRDPVDLRYPTPKLCWNGQLPNLKTRRCPLMQDLHPWDPSYRTPFPTPDAENNSIL